MMYVRKMYARKKIYRHHTNPSYEKTYNIKCIGCARQIILPLPAVATALTKCECGVETVTFRKCDLCPITHYSRNGCDNICRRCCDLAVNCKNCGTKFSMTMCGTCFIYRSFETLCKVCIMNKTCTRCHIGFVASSTHDPSTCDKCILDKTCTDCYKRFIAKNKATVLCDKCEDNPHIRIFISSGGTAGNYPVYDEYLLQITYTHKNSTHDGYCSDSGEITYTHSASIMTFPLLRAFKKIDIGPNNTISLENWILRTYYPVCDEKTYHGSGSCGAYCIRRINSATVIKKSDIITLDD